MKSIGQTLPQVVADLVRAAPLSPEKVAFAWKTAVGTTVDRATRVRLEDGVLLVEADSRQWAHEVMRASPVILRRLQALLGPDVVARITLRRPD